MVPAEFSVCVTISTLSIASLSYIALHQHSNSADSKRRNACVNTNFTLVLCVLEQNLQYLIVIVTLHIEAFRRWYMVFLSGLLREKGTLRKTLIFCLRRNRRCSVGA